MGMSLKAILPKPLPTKPAEAQKAIDNLLNAFVVVAQRQMQNYPPWQPWKNPPKTGRRAGGKRTGDYGRGWSSNSVVERKRFAVTIGNPVTYAVYVGGPHEGDPRQAKALAARGWRSVDDAVGPILAELELQGKLHL